MKKKFIAFVLLQVLVLAYMAVSHYAVEWVGEEVRLKTAPVDPRDLFYGDYVILNYEISELDLSKFSLPKDETLERGDKVYVVVKKNGDYHELVSAHVKKPSVSTEEHILKARVQYVTRNWDPQLGESSEIQLVRVVYGFERYYVPEGEGKELEDKRGQFDVVVKVAPWGQSVSSLSFIANGVMSQMEVHELVYQHFDKKGKPIQVNRSHLDNQYGNLDRPVWVVEVFIYGEENRNHTKEGTLVEIIVDAKTGEILAEK